MPRKNPKVDVKLQYRRVFQISLIFALFIMIGAFKFFPNLKVKKQIKQIPKDLTVISDPPPATDDLKTPPPPPAPPIPIAAPSSDDLEDIPIDATDLQPSDNIEPPKVFKENEADVIPDTFIVVENMPELIGGMQALQNKIIYPEIARKAGIKGKVILQAVVNKKGEVSNISVFKGIGGGCDEAAIKALSEAKFKPGRQRGKEVNVRIYVPIVFALQ